MRHGLDVVESHTTRLLIADDHQDAAESLALFMQLEHMQVSVCHKPDTVLACVHEHHPHALVLDMMFEGRIVGDEVLRKLRADPIARDLLVIVVSAWGRPEDQTRALTAGADAFLLKPADPIELLALIRAERGDGGCNSHVSGLPRRAGTPPGIV